MDLMARCRGMELNDIIQKDCAEDRLVAAVSLLFGVAAQVRGVLPTCPKCQGVARPDVQMFGRDTAFSKADFALLTHVMAASDVRPES